MDSAEDASRYELFLALGTSLQVYKQFIDQSCYSIQTSYVLKFDLSSSHAVLEVGFERESYTESEVTGRVLLVVRASVPNPSPEPIVLLLTTEPGTATRNSWE